MPLGFSPDAGMGAQHVLPPIHCPAQRTPERGSPFDPFHVPSGNAKKDRKNKDSRQMVVPPPMPTNVDKENSVQCLPPTGKVHRKLNFKKPNLTDVPGRITERIGRRAKEIGYVPERPEAQLQKEEPQKRHAKPTRTHTKNLLEKEIIRALDKEYTEEKYPGGETRGYPTPEELERAVAKKTRAVLSQAMPTNNPARRASKELSGRSFGSGVTHGTITKKLLSAVFRRADEAKSREKKERNEVRKLKEGAFATQFLETEEDSHAEAVLLAEEESLRKEKRKSAELLALYPEAHDPKAQPDDLLEKYPEVLDQDEYSRRIKMKESREAMLSVLAQHEEDAARTEKIPRVQTGNGDSDNTTTRGSGRPDRNTRRAIIRQKTSIGTPPEIFFQNPQTPTFPDHMTQQ